LTARLAGRDDEGLRALAASLPGVHDLLPTYRCLDEGASARRLTVSDVVTLGGDADLANLSADLHQRLDGVALVGHRAVVGAFQPTPQSLTLTDGVVREMYQTCEGPPDSPVRVDRYGDGTVYRDAASLDQRSTTYLAQQHGPLARTDPVLDLVTAILTEQNQWGPPMGAGDLGLGLPDLVEAGQEWAAAVSGVARVQDATCVVEDAATGTRIARPGLQWRDGAMAVLVTLPRPGLYRIVLAGGGGGAPVSQLVLAVDPGDQQ